MNNAIFITVRTGSTRLPNKSLIKIDGLKTIEYVINRQKNSKKCDMIILCTTNRKDDNVLVEIAVKYNIYFFRGSENDKLDRWRGAAEHFNVQYIVTVDGDDLFCEPQLVDLAFNQFQERGSDFIQSTGVICGAFTYGIKSEALNKVCEIKDSDETEMMWVYFTKTGLFNVEELQRVPPKFYRDDIRMTLDYEEDLKFFQEIIEKAEKDTKDYLTLDQILDIIDRNPYIKEINFFRQKEFLENQRRKTHLKVKGL